MFGDFRFGGLEGVIGGKVGKRLGVGGFGVVEVVCEGRLGGGFWCVRNLGNFDFEVSV